MKEKNKLVKYVDDILKIGVGFERLLFFVFIFMLLCHIIACLWYIICFIFTYVFRVMVGRIDDNDDTLNWVF